MDQEYSNVQGSPQNREQPQQQVNQEREKEKVKVSKVIIQEPILEIKTPTQVVYDMLNNIEAMRKSEVNRIIKEHVSITLDERQESIIKKTFLFLLGRTEGSEAFKKFLKEKKV